MSQPCCTLRAKWEWVKNGVPVHLMRFVSFWLVTKIVILRHVFSKQSFKRIKNLKIGHFGAKKRINPCILVDFDTGFAIPLGTMTSFPAPPHLSTFNGCVVFKVKSEQQSGKPWVIRFFLHGFYSKIRGGTPVIPCSTCRITMLWGGCVTFLGGSSTMWLRPKNSFFWQLHGVV